jgi:hypothetical protein
LCFEISVKNIGKQEHQFSGFGFSMVRPSGTISSQYPDFDSALDSAPNLIAGASAPSPRICFATEQELGRFVVRWQSMSGQEQSWNYDL